MRIGVIDIGYNAIRAAAYENDKITGREIFNNKFKNDLFNLLSNQDLEIKHHFYTCFEYILHIFKTLGVEEYRCVATAILRDNDRSDEFIEHIKAKYGVEIQLVTGQEEAKLSAKGLIMGVKNVNGFAVDLGGGSLEIIEIKNNEIIQTHSLKLGTKIIAKNGYGDINTLIELISNYLDKSETYDKNFICDNLYFIGGSLRFIMRSYTDVFNYPIKALHNLSLSRENIISYLDKFENNLRSISVKTKINTNAMLMSRALIEFFDPKDIIVSTYGLKEGVRFEMLSEEEQKKDIILEKFKMHFGDSSAEEDVDYYIGIMKSVLEDIDNYRDLLRYALIVLSSRSNYDQTIQFTAIIEQLLTCEIQISHKERVCLALIVAHFTNFKLPGHVYKASRILLEKREAMICQIIGHFFKVCEYVNGHDYKGTNFSLDMNGKYLEIKTDVSLPRSNFEKLKERLKAIAFARKG